MTDTVEKKLCTFTVSHSLAHWLSQLIASEAASRAGRWDLVLLASVTKAQALQSCDEEEIDKLIKQLETLAKLDGIQVISG